MRSCLALIILLAPTFFGCSEKLAPSGQTQVTFHFSEVPSGPPQFKDRHSWGETTPSTASAVDCVGVFVRYPELANPGICTDGSETLAYVNQLVGLVSRSSIASATITSGSARTFYLVGFGSSSGQCPSLASLGPTQESFLSEPVLLGSTTVDVQGSSQTVSLAGSVSGQTIIEECSGGPFSWDSSLGMYGDGSDGNHIFSSSTTFGSYNTAQTAILALDSVDGTRVGVLDATNFSVGDEVMWQVVGTGVGGTGCDSSGHSRPAGLTGITEITAIDLTSSPDEITLLDPLVGPKSSATGPALSAGQSSNSTSNIWCRISLVKIPHYQNLNIGSYTFEGEIFNYTNAVSSYGGIIAARINDTLTLNGGIISANGKGYQGVITPTIYSGESPYGRPANNSVNGSGGGGTGTGGGGASSWGIGGNSSGGGDGGVNVSCSESTDTHCMQMGGAGGAGGGAGGGIILLYARNVVINGTSSISSAGDTSTSSGGGGGGGGLIKLYTSSLTINAGASLTLSANGGNGHSSGGGAGSGGAIAINSCATSLGSGASFNYVSASGTPGTGGSTGSSPTPTIYTSTCP